MMSIKSYRDLSVWQKSMDMCEEVYRLVKLLPKEETYALSDQMRRAAVSVPSNIAEGNSRNSSKDYVQFLSFASGSNSELYTQLILCKRIGYLNQEQIESALLLSDEISKMIIALRNSLLRKE